MARTANKRKEPTKPKLTVSGEGERKSNVSGDGEERLHRAWALFDKSGKTYFAREMKPAVYASGHAHRITDNSVRIGDLNMKQLRQELVVDTIKRANFLGLRDKVDEMMQNPPKPFFNEIYQMLNTTFKVLVSLGFIMDITASRCL